MKYICLRKCFVNNRLWKEGRIYDLPDNMEKSPKNFRLMDEPPPPTPEIVGVLEVTKKSLEPVTDTTEKPPEPKLGEYLCNKCSGIHRESSKLGQKHLKYK